MLGVEFPYRWFRVISRQKFGLFLFFTVEESWQTGKPTVLPYHLRKHTCLSVEPFEILLGKTVRLAFALVPAEFHASYTHLRLL